MKTICCDCKHRDVIDAAPCCFCSATSPKHEAVEKADVGNKEEGMVKHTPGPWECGSINYPESGMGKCEITQVGEMGILAHVYVPHPPYEGSKEGPANARLIAAAPDLYGALKALWNELPFETPTSHKTINMVRAALARVEAKE